MGRLGPGKVLVSLSIPRDLDREVELEAARLDVTKSDLVAAAVKKLLHDIKKMRDGEARRYIYTILEG